MSEDFLRDVTPDEALRSHQPGQLHCATPERWQQIEALFDYDQHPWLKHRIGKVKVPQMPDYGLFCVDTEGLTDAQIECVVQWFYGTNVTPDTGVTVWSGDDPATQKLYDAVERHKQRTRRPDDPQAAQR